MGLNKKSCWVNISFQSHKENRLATDFLYTFWTKNKNILISFTVKLIDSKKKETEFIDGEKKKLSITNLLIEFLAWIMLKLKKKEEGRKQKKRTIYRGSISWFSKAPFKF